MTVGGVFYKKAIAFILVLLLVGTAGAGNISVYAGPVVGNPTLEYEVENQADWENLNLWLENTAADGAVVKIKTTNTTSMPIMLPAKNITIDGSSSGGIIDGLRIASKGSANLTIKDLKVKLCTDDIDATPEHQVDGCGVIDFKGGGVLHCKGNNNLSTYYNIVGAKDSIPVIHVRPGKSLTITGDSSSHLEVRSCNNGAAIGGSGDIENISEANMIGEDSGDIVISGGSLKVTNEIHGAGIGAGGVVGGKAGSSGHISIINASVTANSNGGAGIGGGSASGVGTGGALNYLTIKNSTVNASSSIAAGIGGGTGGDSMGGSAKNITISGINTKVTASGSAGAGIGGGNSTEDIGGSLSNISIADSAKVTASSLEGAGIGGGYGELAGGSAENINISGDGTKITARSTDAGGAGIGGGGSPGNHGAIGGSLDNLLINNATVRAQSTKSNGGAAIGGGGGYQGGNSSNISIIDNASVTAISNLSTGIGGGCSIFRGGSLSSLIIEDSQVNATVNGTNNYGGAGIGGGYGYSLGGSAGIITITGITTKVVSKVIGGYCAGIGGGGSLYKSGTGASLYINAATVEASGYNHASVLYGYDIGSSHPSTGTRGDGGSIDIDGNAKLMLSAKGTDAKMSIGRCVITDSGVNYNYAGTYSPLKTINISDVDFDDPNKTKWKTGIVRSGATVEVTANTAPAGNYPSDWNSTPSVIFTPSGLGKATFEMPMAALTVSALYAAAVAPTITGSATELTLKQGQSGSVDFTFTGIPEPTKAAIVSGGGVLPSWISFDDVGGKLNVTPTGIITPGSYDIKILAKNAGGTAEYDVTINVEKKSVAPKPPETIDIGDSDVNYEIEDEKIVIKPVEDQLKDLLDKTEPGGEIVIDVGGAEIPGHEGGFTGGGIVVDPGWVTEDDAGKTIVIDLGNGVNIIIEADMLLAMNESEDVADGEVEILIESIIVDGKVVGAKVSFNQNGQEVGWYDYHYPILITVKSGNESDSICSSIPRSLKTSDSVSIKVYTGGEYMLSSGNAQGFTDMGNHKWALEAVNAMSVRSVVNGKSSFEFDPSGDTTRSEFATMLMRFLGIDSDKITPVEGTADIKFNDDKLIESWAKTSVYDAVKLGIIQGDSKGNFNPQDKITRQDMFVMIHRAMSELNMLPQDASWDANGEARITSAKAAFTDFGDVTLYAKQPIADLHTLKLANGKSGKIMPKAYTTRAETAQVMFNLLKYDFS